MQTGVSGTKQLGCFLGMAGIITLVPVSAVLMLVLLVPLLAASVFSFPSLPSDVSGEPSSGGNIVSQAASDIAGHLQNCHGMTGSNALANGCSTYPALYAALDAQWGATQYAQWGAEHCPGCMEWESGSFQCVSLVLAAYGPFHQLDYSGDAYQFDMLYDSSAAQAKGYIHISVGSGQLPMSPGDILVLAGGPRGVGHVAIVLSWIAPRAGQNGSITVAQANAMLPVESFVLDPKTYAPEVWAGYTPLSYIHPSWLPIASPSPSKVNIVSVGSLPANNPYVLVARQDAKEANLNVTLFLNQIDQESGFDPNVVSVTGAIGIAQIEPATAQLWGVDPSDPVASLSAAARHMSEYLGQYGGNMAEALAAYNAGSGTVTRAITSCGIIQWQACLPLETQKYIRNILS